MLETPVIFTSREQQLVGIEHSPQVNTDYKKSTQGVVIVVGGPQTRVGSHRLFVQLARALAHQGYYVFRFDYTGAGDSEGVISPFTDIQRDIEAAIAIFRQQQPQLADIKLWGLCDAASAILLYLAQTPNHSINGLVLVNPWVRQASTEAKTYLKSYYVKRLFSKGFWAKLFSGNVDSISALNDIRHFNEMSKVEPTHNSFVNKMYIGLHEFIAPVTILLSGNDLTADEFKLLIEENNSWFEVSQRKNVNIHTLNQANHTFSRVENKHELIIETLNAIK